MSEFAPGSPWKAIVLPALLPRRAPARPLAISNPLRRCHTRQGAFTNAKAFSQTPIRPAKPKNLAKSGTCDVPPRDLGDLIEYY
jgi:hypothetical protein